MSDEDKPAATWQHERSPLPDGPGRHNGNRLLFMEDDGGVSHFANRYFRAVSAASGEEFRPSLLKAPEGFVRIELLAVSRPSVEPTVTLWVDGQVVRDENGVCSHHHWIDVEKL